MKRLYILILFVGMVGAISAQDLHYSQFYNSPININPANTGIFNGDKRFMASYRNQWQDIVPWRTFSGSYDMKFYPKRDVPYFFAGGLLINYDQQSQISNLNLFNINLSGSFTYEINGQNLFTIGALLGYANRGFDTENLTWDGQWNGINYDPTLPPNETFVDGVSFFENALGINYRWQKSARTKVDLGVGAFHLFEPSFGLVGTDTNLPRRFSFSGVGNFMLNDRFDLQLQGLAQIQGDQDEYQFGGLIKYYLNTRRGQETQLHLGAGYRTTQSIWPVVAVQFKNFYLGANFDIYSGGFDARSLNTNTLELHFNYIITDVRPFKKSKVCPIF